MGGIAIRHWLAAVCLWAAACTGVCAPADTFVWDKEHKRLGAEIESSDLEGVLAKLSGTLGWQIYLEPGMQQRVSVRFKNLPLGEGLKRVLGDSSFALIPQSEGKPARFYVFRTSLHEATRLVASESGPDDLRRKGPIPNELIVTLRAGAKDIDALAESLGAEVIGKAEGLNAYRLRFKDESAARDARASLADNNDVAATDWNYYVDRPSPVDNVELSSARDFSLKPKLGNAGNQVIVALVDTAVQPLEGKMSEFLLPSVHIAGEPAVPTDALTHGTSMAETILQGLTFAPEESGGSSVRILPIDVYGNRPDTTTFDVAKGIYAALTSGATVVNLSLGGDGGGQFLADLIQAGRQQGVLFFGAAGNQPTAAPTFPAAYPEVIAVTAGDKNGNIAPYANYGSFIDVIGPSVSLVEFHGQSFVVRGTSAATAYVSGAAAGYRANGAEPHAVEAHIRERLGPKPPK